MAQMRSLSTNAPATNPKLQISGSRLELSPKRERRHRTQDELSGGAHGGRSLDVSADDAAVSFRDGEVQVVRAVRGERADERDNLEI